MEGRVRRARPDDARAIAELHLASWRKTYARLMPKELLDGLDVERRAAQVRETIDSPPTPDHRFWVVSLGEELLGWSRTGPSRDEGADITQEVEVYGIYLHPDHTGRGLGRTLFTWSVDDLRERGYRDVILWVLEGNRSARRFYEAAGFLLDGPPRDRRCQGHALPHMRYRRRLR